jgi:predicted RNA-binding Zn-ribbon protein involved in translation (DUF1610 family)
MSDEMIYEVSNDGVNWLHVTCGEYMLSNYPHRRTRQSDEQKPGAMKATLKLRASALADMAGESPAYARAREPDYSWTCSACKVPVAVMTIDSAKLLRERRLDVDCPNCGHTHTMRIET